MKIFTRIVLPEYPYDARKYGRSGRGVYRAEVNEGGRVTRVIVIKSAGDRSMDDAVVRAAQNWQARPGKRMEVDFPLVFTAPPMTVHTRR